MKRFCLLLLFGIASTAVADEGMWTFDNFPKATVKQKYGVDINDAWLDRVQRSIRRLEGGCTGSFASPDGLMLTNHLPENLPHSSGALPGPGFGLGLAVLTRPEGYGVAGTTGLVRSGGLANTAFLIDPAKRIVAVLMTQYLPKSASRLERDFQALVYQALAE